MRRVYLHMSCPRCQQSGYQCPPEFWTHGGSCGGKLYLDENANIHCDRCGRQAPLIKMRLTCNSGRHSFYIASKEGYADAISASGMITDRTAIAWFQSVLKNL